MIAVEVQPPSLKDQDYDQRQQLVSELFVSGIPSAAPVSVAQLTEFFVTDELVRGLSVDEAPARAIGACCVAGQEYEIMGSNMTALHRSPIIVVDSVRTFLRATFTHSV